jgi:hypothetical protein
MDCVEFSGQWRFDTTKPDAPLEISRPVNRRSPGDRRQPIDRLQMLRAKFCEPSQSFSRASNKAHRQPPADPAFAFGGEQAQQRGRVGLASLQRRTAAHQGKIRRR